VEINRIIIRDGNLSPTINEFSEEFNNYTITSLIDFFSDYDQIKLDEKSRDLTSFHTPIKLYKMMTLPQNATNSVTQFIRVITKILQNYFSRYFLFIDDIGVKGPKTTYNNKKMAPNIRKYVLKHIQ